MPAAPAQCEPKKGTRNLHCRSYNSCISHATRAEWENFTCEGCPLRHRDTAPRAEDYLRRSYSVMEST